MGLHCDPESLILYQAGSPWPNPGAQLSTCDHCWKGLDCCFVSLEQELSVVVPFFFGRAGILLITLSEQALKLGTISAHRDPGEDSPSLYGAAIWIVRTSPYVAPNKTDPVLDVEAPCLSVTLL